MTWRARRWYLALVSNFPANERLVQWLGRTKQTQYDLADSLGISQGQVSSIVTGRRKPSLDVAAKIERLAGIPAASWLDVTSTKATA